MTWKKSTRFPFVKRTKTRSTGTAPRLFHQTTKKVRSVVDSSTKAIESVASQLAKPLDNPSRRTTFGGGRKKKPITPITISMIARIIKYTVLLLLIIAVVVSAVYLALYTRDYVSEKHQRNPVEIIRAAVLLAISISLLVFANSHWHAVPSLSIPLSVSFR